MNDYYCFHPEPYHQATFHVDPTSFLTPLAERLTPGAKVLDVGCGSGRDLLWLKQRGFHVLGLERSPGLARLARENAGCEVLEADFNCFDFASLSVDALVFVGAFVHVPRRDLPALLFRCTAALEQDGLILLTMKEGKGDTTDSKGRTFLLWEDHALRRVFSDIGFSILDFNRNESKLGTREVWLGYVLGTESTRSPQARR
jgi:cyclopropane fatty-acyl-phospholipid synthase-like methyltransferase